MYETSSEYFLPSAWWHCYRNTIAPRISSSWSRKGSSNYSPLSQEAKQPRIGTTCQRIKCSSTPYPLGQCPHRSRRRWGRSHGSWRWRYVFLLQCCNPLFPDGFLLGRLLLSVQKCTSSLSLRKSLERNKCKHGNGEATPSMFYKRQCEFCSRGVS